jgi:lysozyme
MQSRNEANAQGIDVSHYQGVIDWAKVKATGISFAIIKATEGSYCIDDMLSVNINGAKSVGIGVGVYHFLRASNVEMAVNEANVFCNVLDSLGGVYTLDIAPMLDIETIEGQAGYNIVEISKAWLQAVEKRTGIRPMVYSYPSFIDDHLGSQLPGYKLWLADYSGNNHDRGCWTEWEFLQFTDKGEVDGIFGLVDRNEYKGTVEQLMYKLSKQDADKIISTLQAFHGLVTTDADKAEIHRLANELRRSSNQPTT